ncbi:uncharacterized protein LOC129576794 [Sitodiplosis mosellana]|uniref:uncharacterized protein LOC129576794 n=1 Tax=Sitodiplosis mosellana TaxID=263140 RepID=UPI002444A025|nr:uncharacterized protein LOC129576794 [Sitodiplosis mosellana]
MVFLHILVLILLVKNILVFKVIDLSPELDENQLDSPSCSPLNSGCASVTNFLDVATEWNSDELYDNDLLMDETKIKSKKSSKSLARDNKAINRRSRIQMHKPAGVIQRIRPRKRDAIFSNEIDANSVNDESEEFDSDQHVENESDWHDQLDVIRMPHLLGPSATKHSPIPVEHQHLSTPPPSFGCYKVLIQCNQFYPIVSYIPCTELEQFNHLFCN